jgi:hypothetical protein
LWPSSVTASPFTVIMPAAINSSALRREQMPAFEIYLFRRIKPLSSFVLRAGAITVLSGRLNSVSLGCDSSRFLNGLLSAAPSLGFTSLELPALGLKPSGFPSHGLKPLEPLSLDLKSLSPVFGLKSLESLSLDLKSLSPVLGL